MFWSDADVLSILARHCVLVSSAICTRCARNKTWPESSSAHAQRENHIIKARLWIKRGAACARTQRTIRGRRRGAGKGTPRARGVLSSKTPRLWLGRAAFRAQAPAAVTRYRALHQALDSPDGRDRLSQITDDGRPMSRSHRRVADETLERGVAPASLHHHCMLDPDAGQPYRACVMPPTCAHTHRAPCEQWRPKC
jgi:hypothetical protein